MAQSSSSSPSQSSFMASLSSWTTWLIIAISGLVGYFLFFKSKPSDATGGEHETHYHHQQSTHNDNQCSSDICNV